MLSALFLSLFFAVETLAGPFLHGTVKDPSGTAMGGIPVRLACASGKLQVAYTDDRGRFRLSPGDGPCDVEVSPEGFTPFRRAVHAGETGPVDIALRIESVRETIVVEASIPAMRTAGEISQTLDSRRLAELPASGRSLNRFALLDPQIRNTAGLGADGAQAMRMSIHGGSFRTTTFKIDGGSNYEFTNANAPAQKISVSATEEFKALTNQFSAEHGRTTTGILLATTKSGTDSYHGEALFFARPSGIQARPVASTRRTPNQVLQYGASLGGPIVRERTHFFLNYEELRQERGAFIQSPAPGVYTGHFEDRMALARIDQEFSSRHSASLRLNGNRDINDNPNDKVSGFVQPSAATRSATQALGAQLSDRVILSPRAVNEARLSYVNAMPSYSAPVVAAISVVRPNYSTEGGSAYSWYKTRSLEVSETLSFRSDSHLLRLGGDWLRQTVGDYSVTPFGEYRFAPGAPTPGEQPLQYTETFGTSWIRQGQTLASGWLQDEWRLSPKLTAHLGLRYEWQSVTRDANNWAPRAALAWNPDGQGRTTVRASAGVFYDSFFFYLSRRMYQMGVNAPTVSVTLPAGAPGFPVYPDSLPEMPKGVAAPRRDLYLGGPERLNPYSLQYSLTLQHRLGDNWVFTLDAIHSHTLNQWRVRDMNAPAPFPRWAPGQVRTVAQADATRPFASWQSVPVRVVSRLENSSRSRFDGLVLRASRRFARRYTVEANYLINSAIDYGMFFGEPNTGVPADWGNSDAVERGPGDFHQRSRLVAHGLVELPWQSQLSLVGIFASGLPVNPLTGVDNNGDTYQLDRPLYLGRNSFRTPAQAGVDLSWAKRFRLREKVTVEFRAEGFNVLNHSNLIKPNAVYGDLRAPLPGFLTPVAGAATSDPARQFQCGLRWLF